MPECLAISHFNSKNEDKYQRKATIGLTHVWGTIAVYLCGYFRTLRKFCEILGKFQIGF